MYWLIFQRSAHFSGSEQRIPVFPSVLGGGDVFSARGLWTLGNEPYRSFWLLFYLCQQIEKLTLQHLHLLSYTDHLCLQANSFHVILHLGADLPEVHIYCTRGARTGLNSTFLKSACQKCKAAHEYYVKYYDVTKYLVLLQYDTAAPNNTLKPE